MTNSPRNQSADRPEQIMQRRSLGRCAARITDPQLRTQVADLAAGRVTPTEFMRFVDTSPQAQQALRRSVTAYLGLSQTQRHELLSRYDQQLAAIQAELEPPAGPPVRRPARNPIEEDTWEDRQSWLE